MKSGKPENDEKPVDEPIVSSNSSGDKPTPAPSAAEVGSRILGQIVALMTQSPTHRHLFLADLEWLIVPPLARRQMRLFQNDKGPLAFASWAYVSEEVEKELIAGRQRLKPAEWKSGDRLWLMELVCPSAAANPKILSGLLNELSENAFKGKSCKMRVVDPKTGKPKIGEFGRRAAVN
jgi:cytolysin-activating lysine-acyltransferase